MMAGVVGQTTKGSHNFSYRLLFLVTTSHLLAALCHLMLSVVSKSVAEDVHYGDQGCEPLSKLKHDFVTCSKSMNNETCLTPTCSWKYTGLGLDYQLLAGPSFMAVFTTTSILWGLAADKWNRIHLLIISNLTFSTAMILTAFLATKFWHLVILRMMLAFGIAGIIPIVPGMIYDAFHEKHMALAMGVFHWGIYLGGGLSNAVGKGITQLHIFDQGWRGAFLVSGLPGFLLSFLMFLIGKDPERTYEGIEKSLLSHMHHGKIASPNKETELELPPPNFEPSDAEDDPDFVEYDLNEAQVLIEPDDLLKNPIDDKKKQTSLWHYCREPSVLLLGLGACIRQAAGYTWSYNSVLYYQTYYPEYDAHWWLTWITILGGSVGVVLGGFLSDRLVSTLGISARVLILACSQLLSFPFAIGTLWLDLPASFFSLLAGYFFAEMWYGVVFAILVELLPAPIRSLGMAVTLFIINNFGGNIPVLVSPLSKILTYRTAITLLYPGALLTSLILFFLAFISISKQE